jgi:type VI secretion system protein ImpB
VSGKGKGPETELPFKLMVIGDFTRRESQDSFDERRSVTVSEDNFNAVLQGFGIKLDMLAYNLIDQENCAQIPVHLEIGSLRDFEPDRRIESAAQLKKLTSLGKFLAEAGAPIKRRPDVMEAIKSIKLPTKPEGHK